MRNALLTAANDVFSTREPVSPEALFLASYIHVSENSLMARVRPDPANFAGTLDSDSSSSQAQRLLTAYQEKSNGFAEVLKRIKEGGRPTPNDLLPYRGYAISSWGISQDAFVYGVTPETENPALLVARSYSPNLCKIPLERVGHPSDQVFVRRLLTTEDYALVESALSYAAQNRLGIRLANFHWPRPEIFQGRVLVGAFGAAFLSKSGSTWQVDRQGILPESIEFFTITPRALTDGEASLLRQCQTASENKTYVSFKTSRVVHESISSQLFEGWISGIELASDGEYFAVLNADGKAWGEIRVRLEDIVPESFATFERSGAQKKNDASEIRVSAYADEGEVPVSGELLAEFAAFANPHAVSGPELPEALQAIGLGSEARYYFGENGNRIRLTIRHNVDDSWSFSHSAYDFGTRGMSESSRFDQMTDKGTKIVSRYALNEQNKFEFYHSHHFLAANALRQVLRPIRTELMRAAVRDRFSESIRSWGGAIPIEMGSFSSDIAVLLMHAHGYEYDLNRGFIARQSALSDEENKILFAIDYLVKNRLTFWSYNAGGSGVKSGIYPQGSQVVTSTYMAGYSFEKGLLEAMAAHGLHYADGVWGLG